MGLSRREFLMMGLGLGALYIAPIGLVSAKEKEETMSYKAK